MSSTVQRSVDRQKRSAEEAGMDKGSDLVRPEFRADVPNQTSTAPVASTSSSTFDFDDVDFNTMAHTFGAGPSTVEPTVPYYGGAGYQPWWPRSSITGGITGQERPPFHQQMYDMRMQQQQHQPGPRSTATTESMPSSGIPSRDEFTFEPSQLSADFVRGVHYPVLDFSHLFPESGSNLYEPPQH